MIRNIHAFNLGPFLLRRRRRAGAVGFCADYFHPFYLVHYGVKE
jgi:hypothetical protein